MEHVADLALRVRGQDVQDLFVNAAEGMFSLIGECRRESPAQCEEDILLQAPDPEALLIDWLNELLYLAEATHTHFFSFSILNLTATSLEAHVGGNPPESLKREIKSATYHHLRLLEKREGFEVTIVFDV